MFDKLLPAHICARAMRARPLPTEAAAQPRPALADAAVLGQFLLHQAVRAARAADRDDADK